MATEVKKLTIEVEEKSDNASSAIEELRVTLERLDKTLAGVVPNIKSLSTSLSTLASSTKQLNNIKFTGLANGIKSLNTSLSSVKKESQNLGNLATPLKSISSALNGLIRVDSNWNGLTFADKATSDIKQMNSTFQSIQSSVSQLQTMSKSFQAFSRNLTSLTKLNDKFKGIEFTNVEQGVKTLISTFDKLEAEIVELEAYAARLDKITTSLNAFSKVAKNLGGSGISSTSKTVDKLTLSTNGFFNIASKMFVLQQVGRALGYMVQKANDYIETMNLFNVVMGESSQKASQFIDALESIGVDQEQAMRFQSAFYDIGKSLGMTANNAYTLSEQFTKLAYDYSSLYNLPVEESFQKLQAAVVGTTEPIRRLGKDISIAKLEEVALSLGIQESVRNMTQAEKAELRFIAVMQQSTAAMNDMERTINSPANALRILRAQFTMLAREVGSLVIPALSAILPVAIAIVKAIRLIVASIASLFGIKLADYTADLGASVSNMGASLGDAGTAADGLSDGLGSAAKNADKLKDYLLGIDELNVLNDSTSGYAGGGGGGGVGGGGGGGGLGLDLSQFGYDELLKDVKSRADEILESFKKWLPVLAAIASALAIIWAVGKITKFITALKAGTQSLSTFGWGLRGLSAIGTAVAGVFGVELAGGVTAALVGFAALSAALIAVAAVIGAVYQALQPAVEEIDVFGEGVSDTTKDKLEPFIDTMNNLGSSIRKLDWTNKIITQEDVNSVTAMTAQLRESILNEVDADRNQDLQDIEMLKNLQTISPETYNEMISSTNQYYDEVTARTQQAEARINEILQTAANEKRDLTEAEVTEISALQDQMKEDAVSTMSESAQEQQLIMQRLVYNKKALAVKDAQNILTEAKANKDNLIQEAEDTKVRMLASLDKRYTSEEERSSQAYKDQKEAIIKAYDEQVEEAKTGYEDIVAEVQAGLGDQKDVIDYETGQIKNKWTIFWDDQSKLAREKWDKLKQDWDGFWKNLKDKLDKKSDEIGKNWNRFWGGLKTWWDEKVQGIGEWMNAIKERVRTKSDEIGKKWNDFWGGLKTWYQKVIDGIGDWMGGIKKEVNKWFGWIGDAWNSFWDGLSGDKNRREAKLGKGNTRRMSMSVQPQGVEVAAYATGGFVRPGAKFIDPNYFTAGEAGQEMIGNYKGRRTVMPLENTSFVNAMYQAVHQAVIDAQGSDEPIHITIQPQVKIGTRDIKQAQEDYEYDTGGSLIRKIR